ncbi:hypothetical protein CSA37_12435 [Candidatus Fermentibacteria bacterium]|nr:MAG: hypothetical protein CSA37_12435 [Candidatus Fermentibacteria bacterium]
MILDKKYLSSLQLIFPDSGNHFYGYGVATQEFSNPPINWNGSTYIQKEAINKYLGVFRDPDSFYKKHGSNLRGIKAFIYKHIARKFINRNVSAIRDAKTP